MHYSLHTWRWPTFLPLGCYTGSSFDTKRNKRCPLSYKAALDRVFSTVKVTEPQFLRDMVLHMKGSVSPSMWGYASWHLTISYTSATGNYKRTAQGRDLFNAIWHGLKLFFNKLAMSGEALKEWRTVQNSKQFSNLFSNHAAFPASVFSLILFFHSFLPSQMYKICIYSSRATTPAAVKQRCAVTSSPVLSCLWEFRQPNYSFGA